MKRLIIVGLVVLWPLLTASMCVSTATVTVRCPPLTPYTAAQEAAIGEALALLPADDALAQAMGDYTRLRAADKACQAPTP